MARKRDRIICELRIDTESEMFFSAHLAKGELYEATDFPALVGMLEIAKISLLNGRWGIKDAKAATKWRTSNVGAHEYHRAFMEIMNKQIRENEEAQKK